MAGRRGARCRRGAVRARSVAARLALLASLAPAVPGIAGADELLRVTCRGQFQLSLTETALECSESDLLTGAQGGLLSAFSAARADLGTTELSAGAAGGAIRHVGYIGREASALLLRRFRITGDWQGAMPLTLTLELQYGFDGYGEGRMKAALRSSRGGGTRREHYAGLRMRHTALGGAVLTDDRSDGDHSLPQPGRYPSRSTLSLSVVQPVPREAPSVEVRADLYVLATPSLGRFDASTSALVAAQGKLVLAAPCPVRAHSVNGVLEVTGSGPDAGAQWRCAPARGAPASVP